MDKTERVDKAVEEYVEKLEAIKANEDLVSQGFYYDTTKDTSIEEATEKDNAKLQEELKAIEEKFGSEVVEKAQEQFEANQFVKSADTSIKYADETIQDAFAADKYSDLSSEEKAEQILEKFDSRAEQFSDESLAKAFNEKLGTDFSADQIKELKEEIEVAKAMDLSKDNSSELSL